MSLRRSTFGHASANQRLPHYGIHGRNRDAKKLAKTNNPPTKVARAGAGVVFDPRRNVSDPQCRGY